jgi:hypothetical protein
VSEKPNNCSDLSLFLIADAGNSSSQSGAGGRRVHCTISVAICINPWLVGHAAMGKSCAHGNGFSASAGLDVCPAIGKSLFSEVVR